MAGSAGVGSEADPGEAATAVAATAVEKEVVATGAERVAEDLEGGLEEVATEADSEVGLEVEVPEAAREEEGSAAAGSAAGLVEVETVEVE